MKKNLYHHVNHQHVLNHHHLLIIISFPCPPGPGPPSVREAAKKVFFLVDTPLRPLASTP